MSEYRGRFAPTPSGFLHLGSLLVAIASYLDAKSQHGKWVIRIEDIDRARSKTEYTQEILKSLELHGLKSDEKIFVQSENLSNYQKYIDKLKNHLYACNCSRKSLKDIDNFGELGRIYPQICRNKNLSLNQKNCALRLKLPDININFYDEVFGNCSYSLEKDIGDPIIIRSNKEISYALAVVIDDYLQGINWVVRGQDLLAASAIQIYLQKILSLPQPNYLHIPLVKYADGRKFSKQNNAPKIDNKTPTKNIRQVLQLLNQDLRNLPLTNNPQELLDLAVKIWDRKKIPLEIATQNIEIL